MSLSGKRTGGATLARLHGQGELTASVWLDVCFDGAEPQGAFLVYRCRRPIPLIRNEDYGKPLFEQTAHQFSVVIYGGIYV